MDHGTAEECGVRLNANRARLPYYSRNRARSVQADGTLGSQRSGPPVRDWMSLGLSILF